MHRPSNGTDKSNVSTYVASGEVGTSLYMAKGVRVVPNASLLFLNSDYDAMNFGLANVAFGGESSLIGRAGALAWSAAQKCPIIQHKCVARAQRTIRLQVMCRGCARAPGGCLA